MKAFNFIGDHTVVIPENLHFFTDHHQHGCSSSSLLFLQPYPTPQFFFHFPLSYVFRFHPHIAFLSIFCSLSVNHIFLGLPCFLTPIICPLQFFSFPFSLSSLNILILLIWHALLTFFLSISDLISLVYWSTYASDVFFSNILNAFHNLLPAPGRICHCRFY